MLRIIASLLLVFGQVACATPVQAQAHPAAPAPALETCLSAAFDEERALDACIGTLSRPCMDQPGGETTVGMRDCLLAERAQWQSLVDGYVARLGVGASSAASTALNAYIAAHDEWRAARCAYARTLYEGGSLAQVVAAACIRDATAEFAIDLFERANGELTR